VIGILTILAILIISFLVNFIMKNKNYHQETTNNEASIDIVQTLEESELVARKEYNGLLALALKYLNKGDLRNCFRLRYIAALVFLDFIGALKLTHSLTNWEFLKLLKKRGYEKYQEILIPATDNFDRIWYGMQTPNDEQVSQVLSSFDQLKSIADKEAEPTKESEERRKK
jgi:hypothetical protein